MRVHGLACGLVLAILLSGCIQVQVGAGPPPATPPPSAPPAGTATFTWNPREPQVGQVVTFTARVSSAQAGDSIRAVAWDFGDGRTDSGMNVVHVFAAGTYTVRLRVDTAMSGRLTSSQSISLAGTEGPTGAAPKGPAIPSSAHAPPVITAAVDRNVVQFGFELGEGLAPEDVEAVHWEFGDGAQSQEAAPLHRYYSVGTFVASLRLLALPGTLEAIVSIDILEVPYEPRVVVGVTDSGINPYHAVYHRPERSAHPCTYVMGYSDCSIPALNLTVGPTGGSYEQRLSADAAEWSKVKAGGWYWIPHTNLVALHCPSAGSTQGGKCILDDESNHGTGTTSSVLTEAPDALIVFNDGSDSSRLARAPVPIDIESNSWGSLAPLYGGLVMGPTGQQVCHDSIDAPTSLKFRSAGNNGPVPNLGDCWRNGYRAYSVSGGYPDGSHGELSGSAPDFGSYWCRPVASAEALDGWRNACGTSFAAPTAAGTAAAALLAIRQELGFVGGSTAMEVAPGLAHEAFMEAVIRAATYEPAERAGFPAGGLSGPATGQTPWLWWGWGWLDGQVTQQVVDCALGRTCPDNKPVEAWAFNDARRAFASDGDPL